MDDELSPKQQVETWQKQASRGEISYEELEQRIGKLGKELDTRFANGQLPPKTYQDLRPVLLLIDVDNQEWRLFRGGSWRRKNETGQWIEGKPKLSGAPQQPGPGDGNGHPRLAVPVWVWAFGGLVLVLVIGFGVWQSGVWGSSAGIPVASSTEPAAGTSPEATTPAADTVTPTGEPTVEAATPASVEPTAGPSPTSAEPTPESSPTSPGPAVASTPTDEPTPTHMPEPPTASTEPTQTPTVVVTPSPTSTSIATFTPVPTPTRSPLPTPFGTIAYSAFDGREQTYNLYLRSWPDIQATPRILPRLSQPARRSNGLLAARMWGERQGIPKIDLTSGNEQGFIPIPEALRPAWSPTGDIAFMAHREDQWHIFINEFSRQLPLDGSIGGPTWLNGQQLIFDGCVTNTGCGLFMANIDGSNLKRLTDSGSSTHRNPALSPDCRQIAFMSNERGQWDIYLIGIEGETPQVKPVLLTANSAQDGLPAWSPDGRWIAYATNQGDQWVMQMQQPVAGGTPEMLFTLEGPPGGFMIDGPPGQEQEPWLQEQASWFN